MYLLRCLKRKTAVLKLTGGREWRRVSKHWALASGSDRPVGGEGELHVPSLSVQAHTSKHALMYT